MLASLLTLALTSYCQYPQTRTINGQQIVLVTKEQADNINIQFIRYNVVIDSQKKELSKPPIINTIIVVKEDTTISARYKTQIRECYDINRGLSKWFEETNKTAMFFDTCSYKEYKKRYKQLKEIRKNRYN
jgi:hypothetical protein